MASRNEREVGIRLSVKDADVAKRALQAFGAEGKSALKAIEAATVPANTGLLRLSTVIQSTKTFSRELTTELVKPFAAVATAIGTIHALENAIERVKQVAETGDLAERIGLAVPQLQGLDAKFKESGNDVQQLNEGLQTFAVNLTKAASQGGPLKQIFDLNKVKISGDTLTDLKSIAELVKNARTEQDKLYITQQAFGRGEKELVDLLKGGAKGIGQAADEATRLGIALDNVDVDKARELNKELVEVGLKLDAAKDKFSILIAPTEIATLNAFNDAIEQTRDLLRDIQNLDLKGIASIIGRDEGSHPSLFGKNGSVAIDWLGNGSMITGNPELVFRGSKNTSGSPDDRSSSPISFTVHGGATEGGNGSTRLPVAPDSAAAAAAKRVKDLTDALRQQLTVLGMTDREAEISNNLSRAKVTAASAEGKSIAELTGELYDQKKAIQANNDAMMFFAQTGEQAFESLVDGTKSWQDALGDVVTALEKAVLQAELLGSGPLAGLLGTQSDTAGGVGGVFGMLAGLFSKPTGSAFGGGWGSAAFGGARAGGGPVRGGRAYLVGERQPELFVPEEDGHIVPQVGGGDITMSVQIIHQPGSGTDSVTASREGNMINLRAMVFSAVAEGVGQPGNPVHKSLRRTFGLSPETTRR